MKYLLTVVLLFPVLVYAQSHGIQFVNDSNWVQLKARARTEKKNIFVDCYTTWCVWCRWLDRQIFPDEKVGQLVNDNFVSVRIQFDSSTHDNAFIKS